MKKEESKKVLIIIHGAWPLRFKNKFLEGARRILFGKLTSEIGILRADYRELASFLKEEYDEVKFLKWDGKVMHNQSILPAIKSLENLLRKYKHSKIDLIAVSLGGYIAQRALKNIPEIKINKIIYLGAVHSGKHEFKNVNTGINIYSKLDKLFILANNFYVGLGNAFLRGSSIVNIALPDIKHKDLCKNTKITKGIASGFGLFDLYKNLLKNDSFSFLNKI